MMDFAVYSVAKVVETQNGSSQGTCRAFGWSSSLLLLLLIPVA